MSAAGLRIAAFRLLSADPRRISAFYETAFGATADERPGGMTVAIGRQRIELVTASGPATSFAPSNATAFQHLALVVSDMDAAHRRLLAVSGWTAISLAGPEHLPAASGGVRAFKFRDPDGHPLELLAFPPDRVPPAWAGAAGLVLGIDHTAITVADTERSIAFYASLGFTVGARGLNEGAEQHRMDGVEAPRVEVTGLTPPGGGPPHLELLCYRSPGTLTQSLADEDPLATRIVLEGGDGEGVPVRIERDPDGHRLIFAARSRGSG